MRVFDLTKLAAHHALAFCWRSAATCFGEIVNRRSEGRAGRVIERPRLCDRCHAFTRMRIEMRRHALPNHFYGLTGRGIEHPVGQATRSATWSTRRIAAKRG